MSYICDGCHGCRFPITCRGKRIWECWHCADEAGIESIGLCFICLIEIEKRADLKEVIDLTGYRNHVALSIREDEIILASSNDSNIMICNSCFERHELIEVEADHQNWKDECFQLIYEQYLPKELTHIILAYTPLNNLTLLKSMQLELIK